MAKSRHCLLLLLIGSALPIAPLPPAAAGESEALAPAVDAWREHPRVHAVIVARRGKPVVEEVFARPGLDTPVNTKSLGKTLMAALTGAAIRSGVVEAARFARAGRRRSSARTGHVGHLLSMSSGLERTSGPNYGAWVNSDNWVVYALTFPLWTRRASACSTPRVTSMSSRRRLAEASGRSVLALARDWIGDPLDIRIPPWDQDPQGVYFGGNNMLLSPRALVRLGELCRNGGIFDGERVLPPGWVETSWKPRVRSPWSGYGGQMLYVVLAAADLMADSTPPSAGSAVDRLDTVLERYVIPALHARD